VSESGAPRLRKRQLGPESAAAALPGAIDLAAIATMAYSSEDPAHPIENLLDPATGPAGSRWASPRQDTTEEIVVEFDSPQSIRRIIYEVDEPERERGQEIRIDASTDGAQSYRGVLVQEYTFSPNGATHQREDLRVELDGVSHLRLVVVPNKGGSGYATMSYLALFS
jgi:hypothetical protein